MTAGLLLAVLLGAGVVGFVAAPLLRRDATEAERVVLILGEAADLQSRREMLPASLRDLEDDRATAKIDDGDYEELHARLSSEAVAVLRRLDALEQSRTNAGPGPRRTAPEAASDPGSDGDDR